MTEFMNMITRDHYKLYGFLMSPYSMKMRAYLRYRRIPFTWITGEAANTVAMTKVETYMVPVLEYPDGRYANDSTPLISDLDSRYPERSTTPTDEADAFLSLLIEDFADEWLVGPFFLYRWETEADQLHNAGWIIYEYFGGNIDHDQFDAMTQVWRERQTGLLPAVSGWPQSYDMLKSSLHQFLDVMERHVSKRPFFFGSRPSRAEFAIYGMLSQLLQDLTANQLMRQQYPLTSRWISMVDELSGFEGEWQTLSESPAAIQQSSVYELLKLSAKYHLPMLQANQSAFDKKQKKYVIEVDGAEHQRRALPRFLPCLPALQEHYQALPDSAKQSLQSVLRESGCLPYLEQ